jgi:hypothetical protein
MKKTIGFVAFGLFSTGAWLAACSSDDGQGDGGTDAAGKPDTTMADSGKMDSSMNDTGVDTGTDTGTGMDSGSDGGGGSFDFWVARVGTGTNDASAGSESNAVFIEQRASFDGTLVKTIALPIGPNDGGGPFTNSGTATSEADLQLSGDGHYVTLGGYSTAPGYLAIAATSSNGTNDAGVNRTVARIDKNGVVDTTTRFDALGTNNIRSATSNDGTAFWAVGGTGGVVYIPLGNGATTQISTANNNNRSIGIAGMQLYVSASAGTVHGISTVGMGLPTTTNQTITALPGLDNTDGGSGSTYSFNFWDLDQQVSGLDTVYVADDRAPGATGGGVQKWKSDGMIWTLIRVFNDGLLQDGGAAKGCYHVVTEKIGNDIHIVCSTTDTTLNVSRLVRYVDDGMVMNPTGKVIATAPQGTFFRGVSKVPQ